MRMELKDELRAAYEGERDVPGTRESDADSILWNCNGRTVGGISDRRAVAMFYETLLATTSQYELCATG